MAESTTLNTCQKKSRLNLEDNSWDPLSTILCRNARTEINF